jgi:hypothetical protein
MIQAAIKQKKHELIAAEKIKIIISLYRVSVKKDLSIASGGLY